MVHGELVGREVPTAIVTGTFMELVSPPGGTFEFSSFIAFFANAFCIVGVGADFEVLFARHKRIFFI